MKVRLFVIPASHPCATVERALALKGVRYRVVEWTPPLHGPLQRIVFGNRAVPAAIIEGERISGSRAILRRLDQLVPEPPLLPADPLARARVEEAERWGEEVLQALVRRLLWAAARRAPGSLVSFSRDARVPLPAFVVRALAPGVIRAEMAMFGVRDEATRRDLAALSGSLDTVDGFIAEGTLDEATLNAADLQIASSLALLMTIEDLRGLVAARPAGALALRVFPDYPGRVPAGSLPREWLAGG